MFLLWSEIGEWYSIPNIQTLKKKKKKKQFSLGQKNTKKRQVTHWT